MKLLLVDWLDSNRHDGWVGIESVRDLGDSLLCRSIGWLVSENKTSMTLLPHLALSERGKAKAALGSLAIPKRAVVKRKDVTALLEGE